MFHGLILAPKKPSYSYFFLLETQSFQFIFSSLSPMDSCMCRHYFCFHCLCVRANVLGFFYFCFCFLLQSSILSLFGLCQALACFHINHMLFLAVALCCLAAATTFYIYHVLGSSERAACDSRLQPFADKKVLRECYEYSQCGNHVGFLVCPPNLSLPCPSCVMGTYLASHLERAMSKGRTLSKFFANKTLEHISDHGSAHGAVEESKSFH